jgi:hypothetical protein
MSLMNFQVVGIPRVALDAVPDSLLSTLKETRWNTEEEEQGKESKPIPVKIYEAPCAQSWNRNMADWIRDVYERRLNGLPIDLLEHTELEDALIVLDYLGLAPDNYRDITFEHSSRIVQIRAGIFLRHMDEIETAKDFVLDNLVSAPCRKKFFVFAGSEHRFCDVLEKNCKGPTPVARLGEGPDSDRNLEWVANESMRMRFLAGLKGEGLEATLLSGFEFSKILRELVKDYTLLNHGSIQCDGCGAEGHCHRDCPESDVRYGPGAPYEDDFWVNIERDTCQLMYVVQVEVPMTK